MTEEKIARINALYKKQKTEGLSAAEKEEQQSLRQEFLKDVRNSLKGQLDRIDIQKEDGSVENLGERHDRRSKHS